MVYFDFVQYVFQMHLACDQYAFGLCSVWVLLELVCVCFVFVQSVFSMCSVVFRVVCSV